MKTEKETQKNVQVKGTTHLKQGFKENQDQNYNYLLYKTTLFFTNLHVLTCPYGQREKVLRI